MHSARRTLFLAGLLLAVATALGALGSHVFKPLLTPTRFESFELAVAYQFYNSLGLIGIAVLRQRGDSAWLQWSVRLLFAGLLLFCGSIYALCAGLPSWFGMVAPLGGTAFMLAWLCFAVGMWRQRAA